MDGPKRAFRITAVTVFVIDSVLLFVGTTFFRATGWFLALPIFAINLPALPLALVYAVFLHDPLPKSTIVALFGSEVLVSSLWWGWMAARRVKRRIHAAECARGFDVVFDEKKMK